MVFDGFTYFVKKILSCAMSFLDKQSYAVQGLFLVFLCTLGFLVMSILSAAILVLVGGADVSSLVDGTASDALFDDMRTLKGLQLVSSIALFLTPAIGFAILKKDSWLGYLKLKKGVKFPPIMFAGLCILFSYPILMVLLQLNGMLEFPESLQWLENWMLEQEEGAEELTLAFLTMNNIGDLLFNIFLIGVMPAITEEFLFRGVVQQFLKEITNKPHLAILIAGILFSAMHMQFYGFLPRMFLGMVLGYLFYWSGNLWYPIIAHFLNNSVQVIFVYFGQVDASEVARDTPPMEPATYIFSLVAVVLFVVCMRSYKRFI